MRTRCKDTLSQLLSHAPNGSVKSDSLKRVHRTSVWGQTWKLEAFVLRSAFHGNRKTAGRRIRL